MGWFVPCGYCGKKFTAQRASAVYCSDSCRVRASRERKYSCWYCGDMSSGRDRVVPHSVKTEVVRRWAGVEAVECCDECNKLLGANLFPTMSHRCAALSAAIRKKHKLHRRIPAWSEEELSELRGSLRVYVAASQDLHKRHWSRYLHVLARVAQMGAVEIGEDPDEIEVE